jgi:hypothetical protein
LAPLYQQTIEEIGGQDLISHIQTFNAHNLVVIVEVKQDAGIDLFRLDDRRVIQAEIDGVGFLIKLEFHILARLVQIFLFCFLTLGDDIIADDA